MLLPRSISGSIDKIARKTIGKDWNLYAALLAHWTEIVGEDYAQVTSPVKISFPKGKPDKERWDSGHRSDGVLHVRLPQGLVLDFTYRSDQILSRINGYFGYAAIERLTFEPFYGSATAKAEPKTSAPDADMPPEMQSSAKEIEDEGLRQAIESLGKTVMNSGSSK
ncbi:MAG: DciA family protein [Alphaproteobacteria bacterium]|nr:DciA family protein [Alphaproteobacteria bacterium]